jgi:uncharacterized RDD family membrane protein YckC
MEQNHLIDDLQPELIHASTAKRFLNFIIDTVGFYAIAMVLFIPVAVLYPSLFEPDAYGNDPIDGLGWNVVFIFLYILYYALFEFATGGRTPGKFVTGTKAVQTDGAKMNFSTSFKRNAIRLIPFEIFSYFGSPCEPWHDRWVDTMVMDIKQSSVSTY